MKDKYVIILAAGKGARMESSDISHSKVSYPVLGKPLVNYVLDAVKPLGAKETFVVVGYGGESTIKCVGDKATIVWQKEVLGTGHAAKVAADLLKGKEGDVFIVNGDTPLLTTDTLKKVYHKYQKSNAKLTICSSVLENPKGYGRVIREKPSYKIKEVKAYAELNEYEEADINEINSGIYIVDNALLQQYLPKLSKENKKNEYYLSDIVGMFTNDNHLVEAYVLEDAADIFNINDRVQLSYASKIMRKRVNNKLMLSGISIEDPDTAYISPDAKIGKDTIIFPNTLILGNCTIGENCYIGPAAYLEEVKVGNNAKIIASYLKNAEIKDGEEVGPFVSKGK